MVASDLLGWSSAPQYIVPFRYWPLLLLFQVVAAVWRLVPSVYLVRVSMNLTSLRNLVSAAMQLVVVGMAEVICLMKRVVAESSD